MRIFDILFEQHDISAKKPHRTISEVGSKGIVPVHLENDQRVLLLNSKNIADATKNAKSKIQFMRMFINGVAEKYTDSTPYDVNAQCIIGQLNYKKISNGLYKVNSVAAIKSYGSLLYELLMQFISAENGYITPSVPIEQKALDVYHRFMNRSDIEKKQIQDINRVAYFVRKKQISNQYPESKQENKPFYLGFQMQGAPSFTPIKEILGSAMDEFNVSDQEIAKAASDWFNKRYKPEDQ
jgi:hypothetical protein